MLSNITIIRVKYGCQAVIATLRQYGTKSNKLPMLSDFQYIQLFDQCKILPMHAGEVRMVVSNKIVANKGRYEQISNLLSGTDVMARACFYRDFANTDILTPGIRQLYQNSINLNTISGGTRIPWYFIACVHYRESTCNFNKHLHNGDSLNDYTRQFPPNRPQVGHGPPFTFEESAVDALKLQKVDKITAWYLPKLLARLEQYNGAAKAYETHHINNPYLWAGSNLYTKGGFPRDHVYDKDYVNKQFGIAVILKELEQTGKISIPRH